MSTTLKDAVISSNNLFQVSVHPLDLAAPTLDTDPTLVSYNGEIYYYDNTVSKWWPSIGYYSYIAKVAQSGTSNPTVLWYRTNLNFVPTLVRDGIGVYFIDLGGNIDAYETSIFVSGGDVTIGGYILYAENPEQFPNPSFGTYNHAGSLADGILQPGKIELKIFQIFV